MLFKRFFHPYSHKQKEIMAKEFLLSKNHVFDNTEFWKANTEADYVKCIQGIIESKPFGDRKFYIYSFVKRIDDNSGIKKMYHQPRLTRPEPLPGTTLMKVDPSNPLEATIIWTLPNQENFGLYSHGKMFADEFVHSCIQQFITDPKSMMKRDPDDLIDKDIQDIYKDIKRNKRNKKAPQLALNPFIRAT